MLQCSKTLALLPLVFVSVSAAHAEGKSVSDGYSLASKSLSEVRSTSFYLGPDVARSEHISPISARDFDDSPLIPAPTLQRRNNAGLLDSFGWEEDESQQFATYRSQGPVYFKGKAGYLHLDGEPEFLIEPSVSEFVGNLAESGAVGLGAGYKLSNGERLEVEYTVNKLDQKVFRVGYTF
jgi:hypothetical protein